MHTLFSHAHALRDGRDAMVWCDSLHSKPSAGLLKKLRALRRRANGALSVLLALVARRIYAIRRSFPMSQTPMTSPDLSGQLMTRLLAAMSI
jgi:hypothetical protein